MPAARNHNTMTFGGIGQGHESQHDVWRKMDYAALNNIRIREAALTGRRLRVVADLAAAYPPSVGLTSFTRTFTWDGARAFTIVDDVTLTTPRTAEWHLQSDTAFREVGGKYRNGTPGQAALAVSFIAPAKAHVTTGPATVKAPGPPGSIETGPEEERGFKLQATAPAAASMRFEVLLEIVAPSAQNGPAIRADRRSARHARRCGARKRPV